MFPLSERVCFKAKLQFYFIFTVSHLYITIVLCEFSLMKTIYFYSHWMVKLYAKFLQSLRQLVRVSGRYF